MSDEKEQVIIIANYFERVDVPGQWDHCFMCDAKVYVSQSSWNAIKETRPGQNLSEVKVKCLGCHVKHPTVTEYMQPTQEQKMEVLKEIFLKHKN